MCGIVGYLGSEQAYPILMEGLRRLEYRGYDSAGVAIVDSGKVRISKQKGRVDDLDEHVGVQKPVGNVGIGHTRWATHGAPNRLNAHPHQSTNGRITLVHNGIIENYAELSEELKENGATFKSQTDTEVLANLIAYVQEDHDLGLFHAVQESLKLVRGAYAIAVLDSNNPSTIVLAKKSSPLAIGISGKNFIIGSDATPITGYAKKIIYLKDEEVAELNSDGTYKVESLEGAHISPKVKMLDMDVNAIGKGGYDHFMLKEINDQPKVIQETMRGRLSLDNTTVQLGGIIDYENRILRAPRITIVACGTSWHAGLVGKYLIEELCGIPVEVEYASEYRYRNPIIGDRDVVLAISQSGETADTLAAVELAREGGALTLGIVNVVGSSIARATDAGVYTHAGPEISVASTKAFTTQVTVLTLMALRFAQQLGAKPISEMQKIYEQLYQLPKLVEQALKCAPDAKRIAKLISNHPVVLFLGRNNCYPVALEGALKLKEITYMPAEGYAAGEMKHGPIALINKGTPVFVIVPQDEEARDKILSNIAEVKARGGHVIAITSDSREKASEYADEVLSIPKVNSLFAPSVAVVPMQLVSYYAALNMGKDVDKPRNLAKSVTVE